ncbi:MAG: protein-L-isoaspartate(D-aspartate) O-methyltransferase, partial [Rhodothermales bacterium]
MRNVLHITKLLLSVAVMLSAACTSDLRNSDSDGAGSELRTAEGTGVAGDAHRQAERSAGEVARAMADTADFREERLELVRRHIAARGIEDPRVLESMRSVPRHQFVPEGYVEQAYENRPLPIGHGQTISQPYIVAYMTALVEPDSSDRVLEVGTGSGYQAAILAEIVEAVFTVEIIPELARTARDRLRQLGYGNVHVKQADGYFGWEEHAPFDAIVVTAAAEHIPPPLKDKLKDGRRMYIPVGSPFRTQTLMLVEKRADD